MRRVHYALCFLCVGVVLHLLSAACDGGSTPSSDGGEAKVEPRPEPSLPDSSKKPEPSPEKVAEQTPDSGLQCKRPKGIAQGPYFRKISTDMGLADGKLQVFGNRITSVDLNGDGFPDLVVHGTNGHARDDLKAAPPKRYRWVLLNQPDPTDPKKRIFVDATAQSGYNAQDDGSIGRVAHFAIFADVNNDGHLDIFSAVYVDPNAPDKDSGDRSRILLGDGKGGFKLMPKSAGVAPPNGARWTTSAATFLDYDKDGNIDLFVGFWYAAYGKSYEGLQDRLYKGNGDGTFVDVTEKVGLVTKAFAQGYKDGTNHRPTYGVTSCDIDGNGSPDLVVSAYGRQLNMLYLNKGGSFTDVAKKAGVDGDANRNFNDNEFYKCFCQALPGSCPAGVPRPRVQCPSRPPWNRGYDDHPFRLNGNTFTTVCGDINNDGKMDLYHTEIRHWHIGGSSDPTQLILNTSKSVDDFSMKRLSLDDTGMTRAKPSGWNQGDLMAAFFDFDQDGRPDVFLSSSDYPGTHAHLFRQLPFSTVDKPAFRDLAKLGGIDHPRAAGLTVADVDGDGDLDVITGSSRARCKESEGCPWKKSEIHVYENLVGHDANWVRIRLRGKGSGGSNGAAIGARIRVTIGATTLTQEISGGYGHFGLQNGLYAHFGLGAKCLIDTLEIRWPDANNTLQVFRNVPANQEIFLKEGDSTLSFRPLTR